MARWVIVTAAAAAAVGCIEPTDPMGGVGTICLPESAVCPSEVTLARDRQGRNVLDLSLRNAGDASTVELVALLPDDVSGADLGLDLSASDLGDSPTAPRNDRQLALRRYELGLGDNATVVDRWLPEAIGVLTDVTFELRCISGPCSVDMEYVWLTQPLQCIDEGDCPGGWSCDKTLARCVECEEDDDCDGLQTCLVAQGRCVGSVEPGCQTPAPGTLGLLGLLWALLLAWRLRRRLASPIAVTAVLALSLTYASPAQAKRPGASIALSGGPRWFTGQIGEFTERGLSLALQQEVRARYLGLAAQIETGLWVTTQPAPPTTRQLLSFVFAIGPRGYLPLSSALEMSYGADYVRVGLANNGLIRYTDGASGFHALGGTLGVRWRWQALEARVEAQGAHLFALGNQMLGINLGVALVSDY